jgi:hypothetical protein
MKLVDVTTSIELRPLFLIKNEGPLYHFFHRQEHPIQAGPDRRATGSEGQGNGQVDPRGQGEHEAEVPLHDRDRLRSGRRQRLLPIPFSHSSGTAMNGDRTRAHAGAGGVMRAKSVGFLRLPEMVEHLFGKSDAVEILYCLV